MTDLSKTTLNDDYKSKDYETLCIKWASDNFTDCQNINRLGYIQELRLCKVNYRTELIKCKSRDVNITNRRVHVKNMVF